METFDEGSGGAMKQALDAAVSDWRAVSEEWMFGFPTYKAGGTIFALVPNAGLVLTRLPEPDRERLAADFEAGPFQAGEQTIGRWVHVRAGADEMESLLPFVRGSHETALAESRSVPPPADER